MSNRLGSSRSKKDKGREVSVPNAAQTTSEGMLGEHSLPSDNTPRRLRCLIEGEAAVFKVLVLGNEEVSDLKERVHEKGKNGVLATIDAKELTLLKVSDILESSINIVIHFLCFFRSVYVSVPTIKILFDNSQFTETREEFKS
jgi:hypothetical protein